MNSTNLSMYSGAILIDGKTKMTEPDTNILRRIARFACSESGAVTVDWVVLTAAVVGLSVALYTQIGDATDDQADRVGDKMETMGIRSY